MQTQPQTNVNHIPQNQNIPNAREDEPNLEYLEKIEGINAKKDYLDEYLFKKFNNIQLLRIKTLLLIQYKELLE